MKLWIDAQISPSIATWLTSTHRVDAVALRDLGLRDATDREIYFAARAHDAVILTKDADFADLLVRHGSPPRILWLTSGNSSNERLRCLLDGAWPRVLSLLEAGEELVELGDGK